jgi:uncharacterized integral membrane protein
MHLKLMLSLTLAGLAVLFVIQNVTVVQVRFLFWSLSMTLSLFIFLLFATGLIVGWLLHGYWSYRRKSSAATTTMNDAGRALGPGGS